MFIVSNYPYLLAWVGEASAIGTCVAAFISILLFYVAYKSNKQLDKNQKEIEKNQKRININQRILNAKGNPIPLDDDDAWDIFRVLFSQNKSYLEASTEALKTQNP